MNQWVMVGLIAFLIGAVAFFFVPAIIFIFSAVGALIAVCGAVSIWKLGGRVYPIKVHIYTDKFGGIAHDYCSRAKRIKNKNGKYSLQFIDGFVMNDVGRKHEVSGSAGRIIHLYTKNYKEFYPWNFEISKATEEKLGNILIPVEERQWIADNIEANHKVTEKPKTFLTQIMPWMPMMVMSFTAMMMLIIFMNSFPEFAKFFC